MTALEPTDFRWLRRLPFWTQPQTRATFVADLGLQLGNDPDSVATPRVATAAETEADVARLCARATHPEPLAVLAWSLTDLGHADLLPESLRRALAASRSRLPRVVIRGVPHPGLRAFRASEAPIFFGRGLESRRLSRLLADARTPVIVTGPAGSGKTSLLCAGLLARRSTDRVVVLDPAGNALPLRQQMAAAFGAAAAGPTELAAEPDGDGSLAAWLAAGLRSSSRTARLLLVLDDLERLLMEPDARAGEALHLLGAAAVLPRVDVVVLVRADFLGAAIAHPALAAAIEAGRVLPLTAPSRPRLEWMLSAPLTELALEPPVQVPREAIAMLAAEAASRPLPLIHLAARAPELYADAGVGSARPASAGLLPLPAPDLFGRRCAVALRSVDRATRAALPRVLAPLVMVSPDGGPARSRAVDLRHWHDDAAAGRLIDMLTRMQPPLLRRRDAQARAGADATLELAHGALLLEWPQLADWVDARREGLRLARRLGIALAEWRGAGRPNAGRWLHEQLEPARVLLTAAQLLSDLEQDADMADFLTPEPVRLLCEIDQSGTPAARREDIGLRLARIGDPRTGVLPVNGLPQPRWCRVPGGRVMLDGRRRVTVAPFAIGAYPVTHAQFDAFLRAPDGFADPRWWSDAVPPRCGGWASGQRANHPVTQVSWLDAVAFCRWLSARLGYEVRLPDEWEWQWAAQSARDDFLYPWGPDWTSGRANTDEAGVGRTMAVGLYPHGRSLQGVLDLAGNTWEWCRSAFAAQVRPTAAAPAAGVIRGGSWRVNRGFARADFRLDALPEERVGSTGFRLACALEAIADAPATAS
ncbi:MAG: SUMF1/EgtB/PvdO family nonheme iron enzyme [Thiohalocapsa sp.]|jgi:hypothetical protein|uniref:nSTAND1 domain-containing NTPase n=1 Tax=Thiohalocapsa sp. TaxID=2497641 RepID=UPI0025F47B01|nr:SUMF1/EgtB/PvdO family nonheme iron enzyme [Thiohalocapsa sp.]MCG6941051.1 SUMF1/EgtB/PvdO family nonheme iron enzyme [Thiohalocapsa sp.]